MKLPVPVSPRYTGAQAGRRSPARSERGVAGVEAALLIPVLVFVIVGFIELYQYYRAAALLDRSAFTLASGISMQRDLHDRNDCAKANNICTYGAMAHNLMAPLDYARFGQLRFSVFAATEPSGGRNPPPITWKTDPEWSRNYKGANTGSITAAVSPLETRQFPPANTGDTIIVVEVFYDYEPFAMTSAFWEALGGERRMYSRAFYRPRFSEIRELGS